MTTTAKPRAYDTTIVYEVTQPVLLL